MVAPMNPSKLATTINRLYQAAKQKEGGELEAGSWAQLAKKEWGKNNLSLLTKLSAAGVLEEAAIVVQEQALDLYSSLMKAGMEPNEAQEQAVRQVILGFDPEALEPTNKNHPTSETSE